MIRYVEYSIEIPVQMSHRNEEKKNFFLDNRINIVRNRKITLTHFVITHIFDRRIEAKHSVSC
jgi:hypothetical protein